MPAKSKSQQQAAALALSAKRGKKDPSSLKGPAKEMYDGMSEKDLKDFAETDTTNLPDKISDGYDPTLDEALNPDDYAGVKGRFTKSQLNQVKAAYEKISRIDPASEPYKNLIKWLNKLDQHQLKDLVDADINFVSKLARNRIKDHMKQEGAGGGTTNAEVQADRKRRQQLADDDPYSEDGHPVKESKKFAPVLDRNQISEGQYRLGQKIDWDTVVVKLPKPGHTFVITMRDHGNIGQDQYSMYDVDKSGRVVMDWGSKPTLDGAKHFAKSKGIIEGISEAKEHKITDPASFKQGLKRKTGQKMQGRNGPLKFKFGSKVKYNGKPYLVYDYDADMHSKEGVLIRLVDPGFTHQLMDIEPSEINEGTSSGSLAYEKDWAGESTRVPKLPKKQFEDDVDAPNAYEEDPEFGSNKRPRNEGSREQDGPEDPGYENVDTYDDDTFDVDESLSGDIWKHKMGSGKFEVRGTVGRTSNEKVGAFATKEEAIKVAKNTKDGKVVNTVSNQTIYEAEQPQMSPEEYKDDETDEDKLIDPDDAEALKEARYTFKPNQSVTYQNKPWTVKKATQTWVELEDKRGYTTIVDFDDIRSFNGGNVMVEADFVRFSNEIARMNYALGLKEGLTQVRLSMSDMVDLNGKVKSGKMQTREIDSHLHDMIVKKWGGGNGVTITNAGTAKHTGEMSIDAPNGKHLTIKTVGEYLSVKDDKGKTEYYTIK